MDTGARLEPATFLRRIAAFTIDSVCMSLIWGASLILAVIPDSIAHPDNEDVAEPWSTIAATVVLCFPVFWFVYQWVCNALGVSPGKRLMSLRIVAPAVAWPHSDGLLARSRPRVVRGLLRTTGQALGSLPLWAGFLWALWDPENRTLHDKLAGTWVIRAGGEVRALLEAAPLAQIRAPRRLRFRFRGSAAADEYVELERTAVLIEGAEGRSDVPYGAITSLTVANDGTVRLHFDEDIFGKRVESARSFTAPDDLETFLGELEMRVQAARGRPLTVVR